MTGHFPSADWLMAHRGSPSRFPENSLPGIGAALRAGARHVEFDVQLTRDGIPVVAHDDLLARITGGAGSITELSLRELRAIPAGEPARFGSRFAGIRFPTLTEVLALFTAHPATAYVELKRASMRRFGREAVLDAVLPVLRGHDPARLVVLSFDAQMPVMARARGVPRIGFVIKPWDAANRAAAERMEPDFIFVKAERVPVGESPFWPGRWQWVVYGVNDASAALEFRRRGASLIETDRFLELLDDPLLNRDRLRADV